MEVKGEKWKYIEEKKTKEYKKKNREKNCFCCEKIRIRSKILLKKGKKQKGKKK